MEITQKSQKKQYIMFADSPPLEPIGAHRRPDRRVEALIQVAIECHKGRKLYKVWSPPTRCGDPLKAVETLYKG